MAWDAKKTAIGLAVLCLVAGAAIFLVARSDGGSKPTSDEVNAAYMRIAQGAGNATYRIDRATEHPAEGSRRIARQFRSFAFGVDYTATYLQTILWVGPVGRGAAALQHSLLIYESALRTVAKRARRGDRSLALPFRWVREAGADARVAVAAWERTLRVAIAS